MVGDFVVKSKPSSQTGSAALTQLTLSIKGAIRFCFLFFLCFLKGDYSHETECMNIKLQDCLMFISTLKMNFIPPFFLEILQRCCTCYSRYFGHVWLLPLKQRYQLADNFNIYFHPKNQIYPFPLS